MRGIGDCQLGISFPSVRRYLIGYVVRQRRLPPTAFVWSVILHDLSVIATVAWFMLHVYLVAVHPIHRESITSMFEGTVTEEYAREHHGKWIAESLYRRRGAGN